MEENKETGLPLGLSPAKHPKLTSPKFRSNFDTL
jgi:hypothetical protein